MTAEDWGERWHRAAGAFLTHLNEVWERVLDDPSIVPGNTFDEKVLAIVHPHLPPGWTCYLASRFDLRYGRRFHLMFLPNDAPPPAADFDIRLAFG